MKNNMKNLEIALDIAQNSMRMFNIDELNDDIVDLCLKYADGTETNNLTVCEFKTLCNFITELVKNPIKYIGYANTVKEDTNTVTQSLDAVLICPDCGSSLEYHQNKLKFIKHN